VPIGEKAVVADAMEAIRQGVKQKTPDERVGGERHYLGFAVVAVVVPAEADLSIGKRDQPAVSDGDAVGVAAEIGQHLLGAGEGTFGIDDPVDAPELGQDTVEDRVVGEWDKLAEEGQAAERDLELLQEQSSEKLGEHLHREEEAWPAGDPARAIVGQTASAGCTRTASTSS
jgi:hypothetical protein